jgi:hypothetical protein
MAYSEESSFSNSKNLESLFFLGMFQVSFWNMSRGDYWRQNLLICWTYDLSKYWIVNKINYIRIKLCTSYKWINCVSMIFCFQHQHRFSCGGNSTERTTDYSIETWTSAEASATYPLMFLMFSFFSDLCLRTCARLSRVTLLFLYVIIGYFIVPSWFFWRRAVHQKIHILCLLFLFHLCLSVFFSELILICVCKWIVLILILLRDSVLMFRWTVYNVLYPWLWKGLQEKLGQKDDHHFYLFKVSGSLCVLILKIKVWWKLVWQFFKAL